MAVDLISILCFPSPVVIVLMEIGQQDIQTFVALFTRMRQIKIVVNDC